jgi:hypothetical protein
VTRDVVAATVRGISRQDASALDQTDFLGVTETLGKHAF